MRKFRMAWEISSFKFLPPVINYQTGQQKRFHADIIDFQKHADSCRLFLCDLRAFLRYQYETFPAHPKVRNSLAKRFLISDLEFWISEPETLNV